MRCDTGAPAAQPPSSSHPPRHHHLRYAAGPVRFVGDLTIRFPAAASCLPTAATTQLHAAAIGEGVKDTAWAQWARTCNADWAPLAMESTGGIATRFAGWMRRLCSNPDGPLTVSSILDEAMPAILTARLEGTAEIFRSAAGAPTPQAGLRVLPPCATDSPAKGPARAGTAAKATREVKEPVTKTKTKKNPVWPMHGQKQTGTATPFSP
jgi:hypothetical protein